jgi:hypothetical protein
MFTFSVISGIGAISSVRVTCCDVTGLQTMNLVDESHDFDFVVGSDPGVVSIGTSKWDEGDLCFCLRAYWDSQNPI